MNFDPEQNLNPAGPIRPDTPTPTVRNASSSQGVPYSRAQVSWMLGDLNRRFPNNNFVTHQLSPMEHLDEETFNCFPLATETTHALDQSSSAMENLDPDEDSYSPPQYVLPVRKADRSYLAYHPARPQTQGPILCALKTYLIPVDPSQSAYTSIWNNDLKCFVPYPPAELNGSDTGSHNGNVEEPPPPPLSPNYWQNLMWQETLDTNHQESRAESDGTPTMIIPTSTVGSSDDGLPASPPPSPSSFPPPPDITLGAGSCTLLSDSPAL